MTIAQQVNTIDSNIADCVELRHLAYMNLALTEAEVMEEVNYYDNMIAQYKDHKAALEFWL